MDGFKAIYLREIIAYFYSPIAYVLWSSFLLITGYFFLTGIASYSMISIQIMQNPLVIHLNLQEWLIAPLISNMSIIIMFITPLLTMRLLSEEKRSGTLELLISYPLSDFCIVISKYLASLTMLFVILIPTILHLVILATIGTLHWPAILTGYLGLLLEGGAFLALSLMASALTENQIIAAVVGFGSLLLLWTIGWSSSMLETEKGNILKKISLWSHFENFPKGVLDTADIAYFLLFISFFLFLSTRILESKRWKL